MTTAMDGATDTTVTALGSGMGIAITMDIGLVMGTGLSIGNPISMRNRSSSRRRYTIRHSNHPVSVCFFRLIFVIGRCWVTVRIPV
ncbi:hypothetical protein Mettu_0579 [Methylobacter tundripaludum SV96]|uniref:Uncharacterized protein n=1 Tax=Methylobacter tundripaludum (strain ATCC BAA-1195 / DSM 17260 / SV96) TaxID=697282 RepID=G3IVQ9_METTV|nr:hypothetical protein Mettu_0579 [Methylobacter tundripaludum SV96]